MANRKKKNVRSLTKVAKSSFGITLPIDIIRSLGWRAHQKLVVSVKRKRLIVKDWKR